MADSSERTEKPTQRRKDKARKDGNFPSSKEFVTAVQFLGFVWMAVTFGAAGLVTIAQLMRILLARAFSADFSSATLVALGQSVILPQLAPLLEWGAVLVLLVVVAQLATTRFGVSFNKLAPDLGRLNFMKKLKGMPSQNIFAFFQALVLLGLVGAVVYYEVTENLDSFLELPWLAPLSATARVGNVLGKLLWRGAWIFMLVGAADLVRQTSRYAKQLRMSKQEIREESKEQEGSPQMKQHIRRIQRDLARRHQMKAIPTATAVIVNPTHYAVAIRYSLDSAGAPLVVAKGRNYLALRIRQRAVEHLVPIVENPPLARALYDSVDVGQEIPPHLYRAVAEILAYIYKLMNGRVPG